MSSKIDWNAQWEIHSPGYAEGKAHIPLPNGEEFLLHPGPGFGDFSHPTTQLMIELMAPYILGEIVADIGCGSGILSIAAAKLEAKEIYPYDIDPQAVEHTKKNALLNNFENKLFFRKLDFFQKKPVVLMNMIQSEQKIAWQTHKKPFKLLITSGILTSDAEDYFSFANTQNWQLLETREKGSWLGCIFKEKK